LAKEGWREAPGWFGMYAAQVERQYRRVWKRVGDSSGAYIQGPSCAGPTLTPDLEWARHTGRRLKTTFCQLSELMSQKKNQNNLGK